MAVAFDDSSESHSGTAGSTFQTSFTFSHDPVGIPSGVVVFVLGKGTTHDIISGVTYDGVALALVTFADTVSAENGFSTAWFLGDSIPTTDPADIVVSRTSNAAEVYAVAATVTADRNTETFGDFD